jgi:hypothetical protein
MSLHPNLLARDFGAKLRLTTAALGSKRQKDLALAFRRADPDTTFDLPRSYKWVQGRTLPRSARLYEEWAALLGLGCTAKQSLTESMDAFWARLTRRYGPVRLGAPGANRRRGSAPFPPAAKGEMAPPHSYYACYSHAQSPYFQGQVIRGSLWISLPSGGQGSVAHYSQSLPAGIARGRCIHHTVSELMTE